jgi:WD40 repeat protein
MISRGRAAVYDDDLLVVSNLADGLDVYSLKAENGTLVGEMKYGIAPEDNFEVQCAFANGGKWIVAGGTDTHIRIFDRLNKQLIQSLRSPDGHGLVQTICVRCIRVLNARSLT